MKKWVVLLCAVSMLGFIGWELVGTVQQSKNREVVSTMQATDFTLPTLEGGEQSLHETRGKVVILNFWASWCAPCKIEMPHFQTVYENYKQDVEILAVNVTSKDEVDDVQAFVETNTLTFPVLLDESNDVSVMYGAFALPTTIILDRNGNIAHEIIGQMDEQLLLEYIEPLL